MPDTSIDQSIAAVVEAGNCAGCGACCLLDAGLEMQITEGGYVRPVRVGPSDPQMTGVSFDRICPGLEVSSSTPAGTTRHDSLGSAFASWQAWATDPEVRFRGSSGGALTAIVRWLLQTGQAREVVEAAKNPADPCRTLPVSLRTPSQVIEAAGSRYAPVANASRAVLGRPGTAFVGKPCEVSAIRALARESGLEPPLLLSFFCAGTPSQPATDRLVDQLVGDSTVSDLWYRGHGWPGSFTVTMADGRTARRSYDESWGAVLGPSVQWRCKICPDGVGESADIVAADFWESDANGYPVFTEGDGVSALLARTERGLDVLTRAFDAGALTGVPIDLTSLAAVQPLQVERRRALFARTFGARLAGRRVPRFRGFSLARLSARNPRVFARVALGAYRRIRSGGAVG